MIPSKEQFNSDDTISLALKIPVPINYQEEQFFASVAITDGSQDNGFSLPELLYISKLVDYQNVDIDFLFD